MSVVADKESVFFFGNIIVPWMPDDATEKDKETINICDPMCYGMILYHSKEKGMIYILTDKGTITWFSRHLQFQEDFLFENIWDCYVANYYKKIEYP